MIMEKYDQFYRENKIGPCQCTDPSLYQDKICSNKMCDENL